MGVICERNEIWLDRTPIKHVWHTMVQVHFEAGVLSFDVPDLQASLVRRNGDFKLVGWVPGEGSDGGIVMGEDLLDLSGANVVDIDGESRAESEVVLRGAECVLVPVLEARRDKVLS